MIYKASGFNIPLKFNMDNNSFILYSYNYITIKSGQNLQISLPYYREIDVIPIKHLNCEITKDLAEKNISILWSNINDLDSKNSLTFLLRNNNIKIQENLMNKIIGENKTDILPSNPIIRIFIN